MSALETPVFTIRPGNRWKALLLADVWEYRHLLVMLGMRDVKLRYKQTFLGVAWVILQPLLSAGLLTIVFGYIANMPGPAGMPYFAFAYLGQIAWTLFSLTVARASGSLVGNQVLVTKIYFPRPIIPLSTMIAVLLDFGIAFALAVPILLVYGTALPDVSLVVVSSLLLIVAAMGIGLIFTSLSVPFRDVLFVVPLLLQLGMYATPVAYGLDAVGGRLAHKSPLLFQLYMLNPAASLVEAFRTGMLGQGLSRPGYYVYSAMCAVGLFVAGMVVFRGSERKFADVI